MNGITKFLVGLSAVAIAGCVLLVIVSVAGSPSSPNTVILKAKPWNNGYVYVWADIVEVPGVEAQATKVRDRARCKRVDDEIHELIGAPPPIYYYHVNCNGVIGYVEIDQAR